MKPLVRRAIAEINPPTPEASGAFLPLGDDRVQPRADHDRRRAAQAPDRTQDEVATAEARPPSPCWSWPTFAKGETYADRATGFGVGTTTVYRYLREALDLLATMAPSLQQAIEVARGRPTSSSTATVCASTGWSVWRPDSVSCCRSELRELSCGLTLRHGRGAGSAAPRQPDTAALDVGRGRGPGCGATSPACPESRCPQEQGVSFLLRSPQ